MKSLREGGLGGACGLMWSNVCSKLQLSRYFDGGMIGLFLCRMWQSSQANTKDWEWNSIRYQHWPNDGKNLTIIYFISLKLNLCKFLLHILPFCNYLAKAEQIFALFCSMCLQINIF